MRNKTFIATALVGGVVLSALVAAPSMAAPGPGNGGQGAGQSSTQTTGQTSGGMMMRGGQGAGTGTAMRTGTGAGTGIGAGRGMGAGTGSRTGSCLDLADVATGTLTADQKITLAAMAEEEKVAHDLYIAFADTYDVSIFTRIASAETHHLEAVRTLLERYDVADPTEGQAVGEFTTDATQELYGTLLAEGSANVEAAYGAAQAVERTDVADLEAAATGVTAPDVLAVYTNLGVASQRHLVAFGG